MKIYGLLAAVLCSILTLNARADGNLCPTELLQEEAQNYYANRDSIPGLVGTGVSICDPRSLQTAAGLNHTQVALLPKCGVGLFFNTAEAAKQFATAKLAANDSPFNLCITVVGTVGAQ